MSCETCEFCPPYSLGESIAFVVDMMIWNEETQAYEPVSSLADWAGRYILKQGDTVIEFQTPEEQISKVGSQFVINVTPDDLTSLEEGKVRHEFSATDEGGIVRIVFSAVFTAKTSLLWETSQ